MTENEENVIEKLSDEAEVELDSVLSKKDKKEHRGILKNKLYNGSDKLKHRVPKGKQV